MTSKFFLVPLSCISLLLIACQPSKPIRSHSVEPIAIATPDWVNNPPSDSDNFLFGSGVAMTKKEAIKEALADLSSKLGIHVESQFQTNTKVTENGYEWVEKNSESNIKTEVQGLSISQYQVKEVYAASPMQFYVLLKTDKTLLYNAYKIELEQTLAHHNSAQPAYRRSGLYDRYQKSCQEKLKLAAFNRKLSVAKTLNPQMGLRDFQAYENKVTQQFRIAKRQLNFNIQSKNSDSKAFSKPLSTVLAKSKLWGNKSKSLVIKNASSANYSYTNGFYIGRYLIDLKVYEGKNLIGGKQINLKGASLQNKTAARTQAVKKFTKLIKNEGIWNTIGLQQVSCK